MALATSGLETCPLPRPALSLSRSGRRRRCSQSGGVQAILRFSGALARRRRRQSDFNCWAELLRGRFRFPYASDATETAETATTSAVHHPPPTRLASCFSSVPARTQQGSDWQLDSPPRDSASDQTPTVGLAACPAARLALRIPRASAETTHRSLPSRRRRVPASLPSLATSTVHL